MIKYTKQKKSKITKIPQESRVRAELQKEIGSRCPFCPDEEVGHFQIHHIDGDRTNHSFENLLLLCSPCHSKFTKKEWPLIKGREKKDELLKVVNHRFLESKPIDNFDYTCYNMQTSNNRLPEDKENGSVANIRVIDQFRIQVTLKQIDGRIWKGELVLKNRDFGELTFSYQDTGEIEVGHKECYIGQYITSKYREDTFFFKPLTDHKDYGNELMKRITK
jgi:hypothetical protein